MNTCENCIHAEVCGTYGARCEHYKNEEAALHTLRLIYADFMERSNRSRTIANNLTLRGVSNTTETRRVSDIYASAASRIQFYCQKIGFDPKTNHTQGETK